MEVPFVSVAWEGGGIQAQSASGAVGFLNEGKFCRAMDSGTDSTSLCTSQVSLSEYSVGRTAK